MEWSYGEANSGDGEGKIAHRLAGETWRGLERDEREEMKEEKEKKKDQKRKKGKFACCRGRDWQIVTILNFTIYILEE